MSRAFVKEEDGGAFDLPDRPISHHRNNVTREGLAQIETEMVSARKALAEARAREDGVAVAIAARDLRYWSARRASAHVVPDPDDKTHVRFGSSITIRRDDGREQTFRIVGEDEADPSRGTISHGSPLASVLLGRSVGDVVRAGQGEAEIVLIR